MSTASPPPDDKRWEMTSIVRTAKSFGVDMDRQQAMQWIVALSRAERESIALDVPAGIFGHGVSLVDFDAGDLDLFRRLARRVRAVSRPDVESAIAIAGSAAQGKAQAFPGDFDFFERVNIKAVAANAARDVLRELVRATALRGAADADLALVEVNFGVHPVAAAERGVPRAAGDPITWLPADVSRGAIEITADGRPRTLLWDEVEAGAGWTYLGWIVVDTDASRIRLASNLMDVTWESPDGQLAPLDGAIDPFLQEVYLEIDTIPLFIKLARWIDADATGAYLSCMRTQALHYVHAEPNFCKASKRLYNLFRLTHELGAAAYVRELFDQPEARMYEVPGLLEAADVALRHTDRIPRGLIVDQLDRVIDTVVAAAGDITVADLLVELSRLRQIVSSDDQQDGEWSVRLQRIRGRCMEIVSEYFRVRLLALPRIAELVKKAVREDSKARRL